MLFVTILLLFGSVSASELSYCVTKTQKNLEAEKVVLLAADVTDSETVSRLAEIYDDLGEESDAYYYYEKATYLDCTPEKLYRAFYRLGEFYSKNGEDSLAAQYFLSSSKALPHRAEPLIKLARLYMRQNKFPLAHHFAKQAASVPFPPEDGLPFDDSAYNYDPYDILGQTGWYVGEFEEGEQAIRMLLVKHPNLHHVKENLKYYVNRKKELQKKGPFPVDFHESMSKQEGYNREEAMKKPLIQLAQGSYKTHIKENLEYSDTPRIPKIIHQIWLGSPLPEKDKQLRDTWLELHPDWEYKLWTEKEVDALDLVNRKLYDKAPNYGEKSDIARSEILYRFGGLYVDTDFECVRSFDIFHHTLDFYVGLELEECVCNALIGAAPGHPIFARFIEELGDENSAFQAEFGWKGTVWSTGPVFLSRCIENEFHNGASGRCVVFPVTYFYPWRPHNPKERVKATPNDIIKHVRPESYAIHRWHSSWAS